MVWMTVEQEVTCSISPSGSAWKWKVKTWLHCQQGEQVCWFYLITLGFPKPLTVNKSGLGAGQMFTSECWTTDFCRCISVLFYFKETALDLPDAYSLFAESDFYIQDVIS